MQARGVGLEHLWQISLFLFRVLVLDTMPFSVGGSVLVVAEVVVAIVVTVVGAFSSGIFSRINDSIP